jgi:hypothetical protein
VVGTLIGSAKLTVGLGAGITAVGGVGWASGLGEGIVAVGGSGCTLVATAKVSASCLNVAVSPSLRPLLLLLLLLLLCQWKIGRAF